LSGPVDIGAVEGVDGDVDATHLVTGVE